MAVGASFGANAKGVSAHAEPANLHHRALHFGHVAAQTMQTFNRVRGVREVLEPFRVARAAHLVRLILAQLHLVHLVAVEAADVLLAVRADAPLAIRDRMTTDRKSTR